MFPLGLMVKYLYTFEKQKINLFFNNIFQDIYIYCDYYRITSGPAYQKLLASESASVTRASSHSRLSFLSA
jgi:hypothetical protein